MTEHRLDVPHEHHPCWVRGGGEERRADEKGRGGEEGEGRKGRGGKGEKVEAKRQPITTLLNLPSLQGTDWVNLCHITHGAHALQRRTAPLANLQTQGKIAGKRR